MDLDVGCSEKAELSASEVRSISISKIGGKAEFRSEPQSKPCPRVSRTQLVIACYIDRSQYEINLRIDSR